MAGGFPLGLDICNGNSVVLTTALTSGAANTKGSWSQLTASTTYDTCFAAINLAYYASGANANGGQINTQVATDIGVGGAGSEQVLVSNLLQIFCGNGTITFDSFCQSSFIFPLSIPSGTRIAARCQSTIASDTGIAPISIQLFDSSFTQLEGQAGVDSIGFTSASTQGTTITAGSSANTKGSYSQLISSTSRDYCGLFFVADRQNANLAFKSWVIDIAIGGSGSEKIIIPDYYFAETYNSILPPNSGYYPICIPAGTRISARSASGTASLVSGLTVYGVYQ